MQPNLSNLEIRIVNSEKEIPFHLLLAADPSEKLINRYLKNSKVFVGLLEGFKSICIGTSNASIGQLYLYQKQGFEIFKIEKKFFLKNYNQEIFENGIQCKHMLYLEKSLID